MLTPFGSRVHAPWCMAVDAKTRAERGWDVEIDVVRRWFCHPPAGNEEPIDTALLLPSAAELKDLVLRELGSTSLFAAKFREAAARALLLPQRRAGQRAPLWQTAQSARQICWQLLPATHLSRFCWKPIANASAISSIWRAQLRFSRRSHEARFASLRLSPRSPLRSRLRCSSPMSQTISTKATLL